MSKGLVNIGNLERLQEVYKRAEQGEEITIAFLGGSITMGSGASTPETCYAHRVFDWWEKTFPQATFRYVNAGIGATTSHFAVARAKEDVLRYNPDVVSVEFSVNDISENGERDEFFKETYEGLIRQLYYSKDKPAMYIINNMFYDSGYNVQHIHNEIGKAYALPIVSMKRAIYTRIEAGELKAEDLTADMLHPNDTGHGLVAEAICEFLEELCSAKSDAEQVGEKTPVTKNRYEYASRLDRRTATVHEGGFEKDMDPQRDITDVFKNGWTAVNVDDEIEFTTMATNIAVQYRKTIKKPAPIATVYIDGKEVAKLDANFEETWGDLIDLTVVAEGLQVAEHRVSIVITEVPEGCKTPFYLNALIVA